ncbi:hypothetical protein Ahy_B07g088621 [Arachis hypogaea]|uniref:Uncharacterized protein n=1 Tax=Arachis hypogaea TaxID=3818 RepID=A0A444YF31_ARAHY|nr:hypothetical protein Ahy_B07g088621 [Arachis hypogaea]
MAHQRTNRHGNLPMQNKAAPKQQRPHLHERFFAPSPGSSLKHKQKLLFLLIPQSAQASKHSLDEPAQRKKLVSRKSMTTIYTRMARVDDERERLQQPPRVFLMPLPMVVDLWSDCEPSPNSSVVIRQVWAANTDSEFQIISSLINKYRFVSMDTEFPD